jgi:hypothetical protein
MYKVQDKLGNPIEIEYPKIEMPERTAFNLSGLRHMRDRYQLLEDGTSVPVAWSMKLQSEVGGRALEPYELSSMRKKYDRLPTDLVLLQDCDGCHGDGFTGDFSDGSAEICPDCGGYGVQLSPFLVVLIRALDWLKSPEKKIDEATIEKKNKAAILKKEAENKKRLLAEEHAAKLREAQKEKFRQIQAKTQEQIAKEKAQIDRELQEQLAALERQD